MEKNLFLYKKYRYMQDTYNLDYERLQKMATESFTFQDKLDENKNIKLKKLKYFLLSLKNSILKQRALFDSRKIPSLTLYNIKELKFNISNAFILNPKLLNIIRSKDYSKLCFYLFQFNTINDKVEKLNIEDIKRRIYVKEKIKKTSIEYFFNINLEIDEKIFDFFTSQEFYVFIDQYFTWFKNVMSQDEKEQLELIKQYRLTDDSPNWDIIASSLHEVIDLILIEFIKIRKLFIYMSALSMYGESIVNFNNDVNIHHNDVIRIVKQDIPLKPTNKSNYSIQKISNKNLANTYMFRYDPKTEENINKFYDILSDVYHVKLGDNFSFDPNAPDHQYYGSKIMYIDPDFNATVNKMSNIDRKELIIKHEQALKEFLKIFDLNSNKVPSFTIYRMYVDSNNIFTIFIGFENTFIRLNKTDRLFHTSYNDIKDGINPTFKPGDDSTIIQSSGRIYVGLNNIISKDGDVVNIENIKKDKLLIYEIETPPDTIYSDTEMNINTWSYFIKTNDPIKCKNITHDVLTMRDIFEEYAKYDN